MMCSILRFISVVFLTTSVLIFPNILLAQSVGADPARLGKANEGVSLVYIGRSGMTASPDPKLSSVQSFHIPTLPEAGGASDIVTATLLKNRIVSTLQSGSSSSVRGAISNGQLVLVTEFSLSVGEEGAETTSLAIRNGGKTYPVSEFAALLTETVDALAPSQKGVALAKVFDADRLFPLRVDELRTALDETGFDMWILSISESEPANCTASMEDTLPFTLISGLADRQPFGNQDGSTDFDEAQRYVSDSIRRNFSREPTCADSYAVVIGGEDEKKPILHHTKTIYFEDIEASLMIESFDADFLASSESEAEIREYLASCSFCPRSNELEDKLAEIGRRSALSKVESRVWEAAHSTEDLRKLQIYVAGCVLCSYQDEAENLIGEIKAKIAAREAEGQKFAILQGSDDLRGLRTYLEICIACDFQQEAVTQIAEIEKQAAYNSENESLQKSIIKLDEVALLGWLDKCIYCDGRAQAEATLTTIAQNRKYAEPCIAVAGVPQLGGPRLLREIDHVAAVELCERAVAALPSDLELKVIAGRIEHAGGNFPRAEAAYQDGVSANVPMAFGLAAHMRYEPPLDSGIAQDFDEAERLALRGAEMGDWLSLQLLTVLYSQNLISGKSAVDAVPLSVQAAEEGDPVSQFFLGFFNFTGSGLSEGQNLLVAQEWLEKAVAQGYMPANSILAEVHEARIDELPEGAGKAADLLIAAVQVGESGAVARLTTGLSNRKALVIRAVQERLRDLGVYNRSADGIAGAGTRSAVEALVERNAAG